VYSKDERKREESHNEKCPGGERVGEVKCGSQREEARRKTGERRKGKKEKE
jgi:hypothetical protein